MLIESLEPRLNMAAPVEDMFSQGLLTTTPDVDPATEPIAPAPISGVLGETVNRAVVVNAAPLPVGSIGPDGKRVGDVNGDGAITPIDILILFNFLNRGGNGQPAPAAYPGMDVDGNEAVTPLDALRVINYINRLPQGPLRVGATRPDGTVVGDLFGDGDVDPRDSVVVRHFVASGTAGVLQAFIPLGIETAGDVDGDGRVTEADADAIDAYVALRWVGAPEGVFADPFFLTAPNGNFSAVSVVSVGPNVVRLISTSYPFAGPDGNAEDSDTVNLDTGEIVSQSVRETSFGTGEYTRERQVLRPGDAGYAERIHSDVSRAGTAVDVSLGHPEEDRDRLRAVESALEAIERQIGVQQAEGEAPAPAPIAPAAVDAVIGQPAQQSWKDSVDLVFIRLMAVEEVAQAWDRVPLREADVGTKPIVPILYKDETLQAIPMVARSGLQFSVIANSYEEEAAVRGVLESMRIPADRFSITRTDLEGTSETDAIRKIEAQLSGQGHRPFRVESLDELVALMTEMGIFQVDPQELYRILQTTQDYFTFV